MPNKQPLLLKTVIFNHPAFDWKAVIRAAFNDLIRGKTQGGSTITQQLAKNAFLSSEKTLQRKIKELALAIQLERRYAKNEILAFISIKFLTAPIFTALKLPLKLISINRSKKLI